MTTRSPFASIVQSLAASAALLAVCAYSSAQGIPCSYEVAHVIQAPLCGGQPQPTTALAISPNGHYVCGYYCACICINYRSFVFDTQTGVFTTLPMPAGMTTSMANDVSDAGLVVGFVGGTGIQQGFVYDANIGQYTHFLSAAVPEHGCTVTGINAADMVCGTRGIGGPPGYPTSAFIWNAKDGFTDLGMLNGRSTSARDINHDGLVAVSTGFASSLGALAFLWDGRTIEPLGAAPGCLTSDAGKLNDQGWVLIGGMVQQNPIEFRSFVRRDDGHYVELPPLATGFSAGILSLTDAGFVAGHTNFNAPDMRRATIWRNAQPLDLNTQLAQPFAGVLESARIGQSEFIVANGVTGNAELVAVVLAPVLGIAGDIDCDGIVNIDDLLGTISFWGPCAGCNADLTRDGAVNIFDLLEVILNWGAAGGAP